MKHIISTSKLGSKSATTMCGLDRVRLTDVTNVALESDCNECRAALLIGPSDQKGCAVQPPLKFVATPYPDAGAMADALRSKK